MIDSGESLKKVIKRLQNQTSKDDRMIPLNKIQILLPTHSHFDHTGSFGNIQNISKCKIFVHPEDVKIYEDQDEEFRLMLDPLKEYKKEFTNVPQSIAKFFIRFFTGKRKPVKIDGTLQDGQIINNEPVSIKVIFTPGHAPGHISYYIVERKVLVAGDIIDRELELGGSINNPQSNYDDLLKSIEKIQNLDIEIYISGHGDVIYGKPKVQDFIQQNLKKSLELPNQILEIIKKIPEKQSNFKTIFKKLHPKGGLPLSYVYMKKLELLNMLNYLTENKKLTHKIKKKKHYWIT